MKATIELLHSYQGDRTDGEIAEHLGVQRTTIVVARGKERLSPELAAAIALDMGENVEHWIAVAAAEGQKEPARSRLLDLIQNGNWCARRDSNPRPLPSEGSTLSS